MRRLTALPLLASLGLLSACADQFAPVMDTHAPRYTGVSNEGFRREAECPRVAFDVAVDRSAITEVERIAGRAHLADVEEGWRTRYLDTLWVEGSIDADDTAEFELRELKPYDPGRKHYELWRGTRQADGRLTLQEPQPSCGRSVVLARQ